MIKLKELVIIISSMVLMSAQMNGQNVGIGANTFTPDNSALLELQSTNSGLLLPRMTTTERDAISSPAQSLLIFNTTTNCFEWWDSNSNTWITMSCGCQPPVQPGSIAGNTNLCQNETGVTYSISPVSGATTYTWTVPSGATIVSGQGTTSITVNFGTTSGNISVTADNSCGTSTAQTLAVNLQSAPAQPGAITGNTTPCINATGITYSISPVSGATGYTWSVPTGATIQSGQGTTSITVNFGTTSGNISVTAGNSCGTSTAQTLAVNLQSAPAQPSYFTSGSSKLCPGTSATYSINAISGATGYTWTVPTGWTITSNTGTSITVTSGSLDQNGNVSVYAYNSCGNSTTLTMSVSVVKVVGIQVRFGFYGSSSGNYSQATLTFNQSYNSWSDASCDTQGGSCSCSGSANVLNVSYNSGNYCLGTSIISRNFYFTNFPSSVSVNIKGTGTVAYKPNFYWLYSDGTSDWNTIHTCDGDSHYYNNWDVNLNCTLSSPPCH